MILTAPNVLVTSEQYLRNYITRAFMGFIMLLEGRRNFDVDRPVPDNDREYGRANKGFFTIFNASQHDQGFDRSVKSISIVTDGNHPREEVGCRRSDARQALAW